MVEVLNIYLILLVLVVQEVAVLVVTALLRQVLEALIWVVEVVVLNVMVLSLLVVLEVQAWLLFHILALNEVLVEL